MKLFKNIMNNHNLPNIEEVKTRVLSDKDVKDFLEAHKSELNEDLINLGLSKLNEFIVCKNNQNYKCELVMFNGQINIKYLPKDESQIKRFADKVSTKFVTDETTKKFKGIYFDDVEVDEHNSNIIDYLKKYVNSYKYGDDSKGLYIYGPFGVGKSYLLGALANELHSKGAGVTYISSSNMMDDIYRAIQSNGDSIENKIKKIMGAEILIIDDLGTEKPTDFTIKRVLYPIVKYRGEYNKPTFITSNLTKRDYYIQLNNSRQFERMDLARLQEQLDVLTKEINMIGTNRRVKA